MDSYDAILISLVLIFCVLHGWFSAAIAAVHTLGSQLGNLVEKQPKLAYYRQKKNTLKCAEVVERIACTALLAVMSYAFASVKGWIPFWEPSLGWVEVKELVGELSDNRVNFGYDTLLYALPGLTVLLLSVLVDGLARGIGRKNAGQIAEKSIGYVRFLVTLLLPLRGIYTGMEHLSGGKPPIKEHVTEEDIIQMVNAGNENGVIEEQQREMINNIFAFDDRTVSEVMTHRKELVAVDVEMEINDVVSLARDENYSRMPVYQDSVDNIIGVLNTKDLLGLIGCRDISGFHVHHFMREALFVPETAKCDDVLSDMLRKKMQMAIVVDEYGGTAGVVCMEDILEEIVGNIQDEYDEEEAEVRRVTDQIYTIDGSADPDEVFPMLGLSVPEEQDFGTMSGFIVDLLGRIPDMHETPSVLWKNVRFTVMIMEDNWIAKIKAEILLKEEENNRDYTDK